MMTQEASNGKAHGGRPGAASIPNVNHALHELRKLIEQESLESIAIPKLATGVGGLKWEEVKPLIYKQLEEIPATVYIYSTYVKGQAAAE